MLATDSLVSSPAALVAHDHEGWVRISGPDRRTWLQGITTADLTNMAGGAFWGLLLDRTGKIRHELIGIDDGTSFYLGSMSEGLDSLYHYLDSMLVMEDACLEADRESSFWSLHGYRAAVAPPLFGTAAAGRLAWVTQSDWVFAVGRSEQSTWLTQMKELGLVPSEENEWERLRIAAGIPRWGVDYSGHDTPHHAGLFGRAVAPNKGCYIGQEVVCKVEMRGHVPQRIARLILDSVDGVTPGSPVILSESAEPVGAITSIAPAKGGRVVFALARVKTAVIDRNPELRVGSTRARFAADANGAPA